MRRPRRIVRTLLAVGLVAGCSSADSERPRVGEPARPPTVAESAMAESPAAETPEPTGTITAELLQGSTDAARGRMQVWIRNDTAQDLDPLRLVYRDPRLPRPLLGERLRVDPAGSERGYPLTLPPDPRCDRRSGSGSLTIVTAAGRQRVAVQDPNDTVGRYQSARCFERDLAEVVGLRWLDRVPIRGEGTQAVGGLVLDLRPTGRSDREVRLLSVGGTPLFGAPEGQAWEPDLRVRGTDGPRRLELPLAPARCDGHAFMESGGMTAFRLHLTLDGEPGEVVLRMSPAGTAQALVFAREACGLT